MTDPFVVHVAALRRDLGATDHVSVEGPFDPNDELGPEFDWASRIALEADMVIDVDLQSFSGGVSAKGSATAPWTGVCSRCAIAVGGSLVAPLDERFVPGGGTEVDEEAYPITEDAIDLGEMGREALLVDLPLLPLCKPDCQGLCPTCGVDRNEETCSCQAPIDPRWGALEALRIDEEPSGN